MSELGKQWFSVTGLAGGLGEITVSWEDGKFEDASGRVEVLVGSKGRLAVTPTGPFMLAARRPALDAYVTACHALDSVSSVDGIADQLQAELVKRCELPHGVTP